jgi:LmbE family N-acetylglucosaminyl deacetylase
MIRRQFLNSAMGAAALGNANGETDDSVVVERASTGTPGAGKVLALITPHLDDGPIFASGTIAKLLKEGYTGYLIRTSNDEKDSFKLSLGETVLANERDSELVIRALGLKRWFDLSYRNHRMDDVCRTELRGRLIFLFRLLKVDTVFSYDPWGHYEENPDHYVTAQAVEAACWMSGGRLDLPEHFDAGLTAHSVSEKYYFARGPQLVNRVVDIGSTLTTKLMTIEACRTMISHMVNDLKVSLAERKLSLPALAGNEEAANSAFVKLALLERDRSIGKKHGLEYAEEFHYIGPDTSLASYIEQNAVAL